MRTKRGRSIRVAVPLASNVLPTVGQRPSTGTVQSCVYIALDSALLPRHGLSLEKSEIDEEPRAGTGQVPVVAIFTSCGVELSTPQEPTGRALILLISCQRCRDRGEQFVDG
jgi:hypothetical protein